ncbi:MAG: GNAT family N-acetyltransferase [Oscillospiraceae bacterium]|nr:GNAT family N-acetyltransferase [Oscillospiraceae bacterium]
MSGFRLVREYLLSRLGVQGTLGAAGAGEGLTIAEAERRLRREMSYGYVHMLWIADFGDGTVIASVPPGVSGEMKAFLREQLEKKADITDDAFITPLKALADNDAKRLFGQKTSRCFTDLMFACDAETLAPACPDVNPVRIVDDWFTCEKDIHYPGHCVPDGIVYGVVVKEKIVSVAYAHRTGAWQDRVADIGVETSKRYRKRGYARACVNAVARHAIQNGGESLYKCAPTNTASVHTALSAGYRPYGKSLILGVEGKN